MNILTFDPSKSILLLSEDVFIRMHGNFIGKEMQKALVEKIQGYFRAGRDLSHFNISENIISAVSELYIANDKSKKIFIELFVERSDEYMARFTRKPVVHKPSRHKFPIWLGLFNVW